MYYAPWLVPIAEHFVERLLLLSGGELAWDYKNLGSSLAMLTGLGSGNIYILIVSPKGVRVRVIDPAGDGIINDTLSGTSYPQGS